MTTRLEQKIDKLIIKIDRLARSMPDTNRGSRRIPGDELFSEAKRLVIEVGQASTSYLQRRLGIGYARAASLIDQLEDGGVIGPAIGIKPRKVIVKK